MRIYWLDEVVNEKLEGIEGHVVDFEEKVDAIDERLEVMVEKMEMKDYLKQFGWKCLMFPLLPFVWCLVKFGSFLKKRVEFILTRAIMFVILFLVLCCDHYGQ